MTSQATPWPNPRTKERSRTATRLVTLFAAASLAASIAALGGCTRSAQADASSDDRAARISAAQTPPPAGRKAVVTPALAAKADAVLREHADAAIGSEHPFELDGRRYVGRIEEHDNPAGEPGRPPGKHRGVTVYEAQ